MTSPYYAQKFWVNPRKDQPLCQSHFFNIILLYKI